MPTLITLDSTKIPNTFEGWEPNALNQQVVFAQICHAAKVDVKSQVRGNLPGSVFHSNYLSYLEFCYGYHYTPIISPDILWFGLLNEVASLIKDNPEAVRSLFTDSTEKVRIIVPTGDHEVIPLDAIVDKLRGLIPSGADTYLPEFTTTTPSSRFAHYAALCDAVSPYYSYSMFMCGFPAVRIDGTLDDYIKLAESWRALPALLKQQDSKYWDSTQKILEDLVVAIEGATSDRPLAIERAKAFFNKIFRAVKCGSGSQTEVDGWFVDLFRKQPNGLRYASNFATHIAKVEYDEMDSGREFTMLYGLFSSELSNGVAIPVFSPLVFERKNPDKKAS